MASGKAWEAWPQRAGDGGMAEAPRASSAALVLPRTLHRPFRQEPLFGLTPGVEAAQVRRSCRSAAGRLGASRGAPPTCN
eukprot:13211278-Alexandrium_andersonii.AAC.1